MEFSNSDIINVKNSSSSYLRRRLVGGTFENLFPSIPWLIVLTGYWLKRIKRNWKNGKEVASSNTSQVDNCKETSISSFRKLFKIQKLAAACCRSHILLNRLISDNVIRVDEGGCILQEENKEKIHVMRC